MRLSAPIYHLKRRAKLLARKNGIPLHQAQDRIATEEGFNGWSLMAASLARQPHAESSLLPRLSNGDMLLLAARPGHGKTREGLQLLLDAAREGHRSVFFTLEYSERDVVDRIDALAAHATAPAPEIVTSNEISAAFIIRYLADAPSGTVAVIDYLQLLDQQRHKPPLAEQMLVLKEFARRSGIILGFVSQIDRSYDPARNSVPRLDDIRLPNPIPPGTFSKACFLHAGEVRFDHIA